MNKKTIVVLGGGLVKDKSGKWRTTLLNEGDNFGPMCDRLRVVAAGYLYKDDPEQMIIASGGRGQLKDVQGAPTIASVIKNELMELGVPEEKIIEEDKSDNTYQQLKETHKIVRESGFGKIIFVSNEVHLPRVKAMLDCKSDLREIINDFQVELKPAEDILIERDPEKWQKKIREMRDSEGMERRRELEERGAQEIRNGEYKFR